jgi:hypothetical protein
MIYLSTKYEFYLNGMGNMLGWAWPAASRPVHQQTRLLQPVLPL